MTAPWRRRPCAIFTRSDDNGRTSRAAGARPPRDSRTTGVRDRAAAPTGTTVDQRRREVQAWHAGTWWWWARRPEGSRRCARSWPGCRPTCPRRSWWCSTCPPSAASHLAAILDRCGALPAHEAVEGDVLLPGHVYVAPPDRHVVVVGETLTLVRGPRENGHRPSVDVLFRSAARSHGPRAVGVVLSGTLDDGTVGALSLHSRGATCLVQEPDDAAYPGMPASVLAADHPDHVLPVAAMPALLVRLLAEDLPGGGGTGAPGGDVDGGLDGDLVDVELAITRMEDAALSAGDRPGVPSPFACPDCAGVLFELVDGPVTRYRCRVGHAWSPDSLSSQQSTAVESALWMALRALEEKAALADRLADNAARRQHRLTEHTFTVQAGEARASALVLRDLVERTSALTAMAAVESEAELAAARDLAAELAGRRPAGHGHGSAGGPGGAGGRDEEGGR
nr:chemotaxis protein CheB [Cellulomonas marina]